MSGSIAKKLRFGIIDKLKQYDCYIDNELPDYIMVLIANKKSSSQMKEDLSLFVGDHVSDFVDWLHYCLDEIKAGSDPFVKETLVTIAKNTEFKVEETPKMLIENNLKKIVKSQELSTKPVVNNLSNNLSDVLIKNSLNDESKENSLKQNPTTRNLIKFTNNDNKDINNSQTSDQNHQQKNQKEEVNPSKLTKPQHRPIVYNLNDREDNQDKSLNKRFKSHISTTPKSSITTISKPSIPTRSSINHDSTNHIQSNKRNTLSLNSKVNFKQQSNLNKNSNLQSNSPIGLQSIYYQKRSLNTNQQNSSNPQFYNYNSLNSNQPHNYPTNNCNQPNNYQSNNNLQKFENKNQSLQHQPLNIIERMKRENQQIEHKTRPMIFKAIEEANKQSNLESISLRKQDKIDSESSTKTESVKMPLISRLGRISSTNDVKTSKPTRVAGKIESKKDIQREKRLIKFKQNEPVKNEKQNELLDSEKGDLRQILERKRKLPVDENNSQYKRSSPKKLIDCEVINDSKVSKNDIEDDEELKILKDKIKLKPSLIAGSKKEDGQNNGIQSFEKSEIKKDENLNLIIKRELIEKMENIQGMLNEHKKLKSLSSVKQSTKEVLSAKKERCYWWPVCSNQDKCQYHHPKNLCNQFPHCKHGEKCLFIHPNCKFDSICAKIDCPYTHLTRKLQASKPLQSTIQKVQLYQKS